MGVKLDMVCEDLPRPFFKSLMPFSSTPPWVGQKKDLCYFPYFLASMINQTTHEQEIYT
jgi:hypothetical protein